MYRIEEWILLFVFLICIVLTVRVIMIVYKHSLLTTRRKRESHILDELIRIAHSEDEPESGHQRMLNIILDAFPAYKIDACLLLQRDRTGTLRVQASTKQPGEMANLSFDEQDYATWVMTCGQDLCLYESFPHVLSTNSHFTQRAIMLASTEERVSDHYVRFLPLKVDLRTVGVLHLCIHNDAPFFVYQDMSAKEIRRDAQAPFFWTLLSQVAVLIESLPVTEPARTKEEATPL